MAASISRSLRYQQWKRFSYLVQRCSISHASASISPQEMDQFTKYSEMWNPDGTTKILHTMNRLRVKFIMDSISASQNCNAWGDKLCLDVGCGGGILTEALAKSGLTVDGLDTNHDMIQIASSHARLDKYLTNLNYHCTTIEKFGTKNCDKYDVIVISEVIEHILSKQQYLDACLRCLKPGGSLFITTLNKTFLSWLVNVIIAQEILNVIPKNTHDWNNFISPEDIGKILKKYKCEVKIVKGMYFDFVTSNWFWTPGHSFWYALHAVKE